MKKVLVIDNYDSFTYNLVHAIEEILGYEIDVWRNDMIDYNSIDRYDYIILSPGPGIPDEAGELKNIIKQYSDKIKMLGVCLGHQAIGEVYGAQLENLKRVYHGVQTPMDQSQKCALFEEVSSTFQGGRYHSWVIKKDTLPKEFIITSKDEKGEIMSFRHREHQLYGVQFHPESILTPEGNTILKNFLNV